MKLFKSVCAITILCAAFSSSAQQSLSVTGSNATSDPSPEQDKLAYVTDDLYVYLLAGPGKNFRILGSITAGEEITLTGLQDNNYQQLVDSKNRTGWLEAKYINTSSGLRVAIAELNGQLANSEENHSKLVEQLKITEDELVKLKQQHQQVTEQLTTANNTLAVSQEKLAQQDTELQKEWFYNGAIVLLVGLLIGILVTRLPARKKPSMQSWK